MAAAVIPKRLASWMAKPHANATNAGNVRCISTLPTNLQPSHADTKISNCSAPLTLPSRRVCRASPAFSAQRRCFTNKPSSWDAEYEGLIAKRNQSIVMNPDGYGKDILPGNYVLRKNPKTGAERKVLLEFERGYFWAFKELELTNNKPILSNEALIPATEAEKFPAMKGLVNLNDEEVDIPDFFTRNNRSKDANATCTLVAISCKDFGARLLPSWTDPFEEALGTGKDAGRFEVVRISINEGRMAKLLSPFIVSGTKRNVPEKDHANTLLYYGDAGEMRDVLRMHNEFTSYVFLVDGIGRVRWAGSGEGSHEEVLSLIDLAKLLTSPPLRAAKQKQLPPSRPRVGKKVPAVSPGLSRKVD